MKTILTICAMLFIIACTKQTTVPAPIKSVSPIVSKNNVILKKFTNIVWTLKDYSYQPDYKLVPYKGNMESKTFYTNGTCDYHAANGITFKSTWRIDNDSTIATKDTTCLNYSSIYCGDKTYINMPNDTNLYLWTYNEGAINKGAKILMHYTGKY